MGAVAVTSEEDVWGASRSFILRMLEHFIAQAGEKPYLLAFKEAFDDGYNSFSLYDLPDEDYREFLGLVRIYAEYSSRDSDETYAASALRLLDDLVGRMEKADR
jgi:hypothetical protein